MKEHLECQNIQQILYYTFSSISIIFISGVNVSACDMNDRYHWWRQTECYCKRYAVFEEFIVALKVVSNAV